MTDTTPTPTLTARLKADPHACVVGLGGLLVTGAVIYFNGSYGWQLSAGMCVAFVGCAIAKDGLIAYAWAARGRKGRVAAAIVGIIAFAISCLAAIGTASHGRQEAADPKAQEISRYDSAERTHAAAIKRLAELGKVPATEAEAKALADRALTNVDKAIAKRTGGCSSLEPADAGPKQVKANREACQAVTDARARIAGAKDAEKQRQKIEEAEAIIALGKPASSDAQATTLAAFFGMFTALQGIEGVQAWTNLFVGLGLEIMSSMTWAAFAAMVAVPVAQSAIGTGTEQTSFPANDVFGTGTDARRFLAVAGSSRVPHWNHPGFPESSSSNQSGFPTGSGPKGGTRKPRSEPQRRADLIAKELRDRGEVPQFTVVRNEYARRFGAELPKVTAHRACG